jgi:hypothetical protein
MIPGTALAVRSYVDEVTNPETNKERGFRTLGVKELMSFLVKDFLNLFSKSVAGAT